jgi:hypothetical protein
MSKQEKEQAAKAIIEKAFAEVTALGVKVDIPRQGHITLNPVDFAYWYPPTLEELLTEGKIKVVKNGYVSLN